MDTTTLVPDTEREEGRDGGRVMWWWWGDRYVDRREGRLALRLEVVFDSGAECVLKDFGENVFEVDGNVAVGHSDKILHERVPHNMTSRGRSEENHSREGGIGMPVNDKRGTCTKRCLAQLAHK